VADTSDDGTKRSADSRTASRYSAENMVQTYLTTVLMELRMVIPVVDTV
jgi:hypothetical protein